MTSQKDPAFFDPPDLLLSEGEGVREEQSHVIEKLAGHCTTY